MSRRDLAPDLELLTAAVHFRCDPNSSRDRLRGAAAAWQEECGPAGSGRPYIDRLAIAALACVNASKVDLPLAHGALGEILDAAFKEQSALMGINHPQASHIDWLSRADLA